ncbi:unnamed protein product [Polarella glacialis]|uniref:Uncharacterized protein n=1 Tax=Polarella glacialis TaxID=89957 RepID=A0A813IDH6_POLGL|nr:unnamed protein product [Polarella glacialis]CAE8649135.1 unnamed protein product [Polarella glacialis]
MIFSRLASVALLLLATTLFEKASGKTIGEAQAALEVQRVVHSTPAEQNAFVQALVNSVMKQGSYLTDIQREIVERLNTTFYNQTLPEMNRGHAADEELLNEHKTGLATCDQELQQRHGDVMAIAGEKDQLEGSQLDCD